MSEEADLRTRLQDSVLAQWLGEWVRARIAAGRCISVWHITTPREPACRDCGEVGPQVWYG